MARSRSDTRRPAPIMLIWDDAASLTAGDATTDKDGSVGKTSSGDLVNFVKSGNPDGEGLPNWQRYDEAGPMMMDLSADGIATTVQDR